jgi:hypothetical protein
VHDCEVAGMPGHRGFCARRIDRIGFLAHQSKNGFKHRVICLRVIRIPKNVCWPGFLSRGV